MSTRNQRAKKARRGDRSFQPSAAGKGDGDRTSDVDAYRANYDEIDWGKHKVKIKFPVQRKGDPVIFDGPEVRWNFDWSADQ